MEHKEESFQSTYSAAEQSEVERIRKKYLPREESKLELLRRLDRSVFQKAQAWALSFGIVGSLVLGAGMSLVMSDLGELLGLQPGLSMAVGVGAGVIGLALVALAYPIFNRVLEKERRRIAPEILRLTDELTK